MNSLSIYLIISALLFSLGLLGILQRRNLIGMLISVELLLNAANLNFMAFNRFLALRSCYWAGGYPFRYGVGGG